MSKQEEDMKSKKVAQMGLMIALAFVLGYLESLFPIQMGVPGMKLGLANIVVLIAIIKYKPSDALFLAVVRAVLTGLTFGTLYSMAYSLSGGILSTIIMLIMHKFKKFSIIGISVVGGVMHNMGQLMVASVVLKSLDLKYYAGFLIVCGVITGALTGTVCMVIQKNLRSQ